ncbi:hypothetical protein [Aurantimonas sp. HBX-1]|uniref:hypothetical protein n=1 Tax=Aurantimonas sp. HBX-1 TaxID=2906072 RepID=UPI001F3D018E|nr:hypothetical protein [Aurantimonas sp. HBX-1]UIJ70636.1 hypothetical protein LXB15_12840 [Aurantimonas sp. HBX-1]
MRVTVRVKAPRLRPVMPADTAALRARLAALRDLVGNAPLPRTSRLREAGAGLVFAKAARRGDARKDP